MNQISAPRIMFLIPIVLSLGILFDLGLSYGADEAPASIQRPQTPPTTTPQENQVQGKRPDFKSAESMSERIVSAIRYGDAKSQENLFFPRDAFMALKDIPDAAKYYDQLIQEFEGHVRRQHLRFKTSTELKFQKFKPGFCKWKAVGTEYNKIPYWSCYRSEITALDGDKTVTIPVKVMINWGANWYVTHLGYK